MRNDGQALADRLRKAGLRVEARSKGKGFKVFAPDGAMLGSWSKNIEHSSAAANILSQVKRATGIKA